MVFSTNYECKFVDKGILLSNAKLYAVFHPEFASASGTIPGRNNQLQVVLADDDEDDRMFFADAI
ncbi:MAG: hypothetical protein ACHQFW_12400, partial [Chitinophagales bacterium]